VGKKIALLVFQRLMLRWKKPKVLFCAAAAV
jgi:hypothetical protein